MLKKGDRVKVYNRTASGRVIEEGVAILQRPEGIAIEGEEEFELWVVRFPGEYEFDVTRRVRVSDKVSE